MRAVDLGIACDHRINRVSLAKLPEHEIQVKDVTQPRSNDNYIHGMTGRPAFGRQVFSLSRPTSLLAKRAAREPLVPRVLESCGRSLVFNSR